MLLMEVVEENAALSDEERGNLLGECDLIMSFLCYNDIGAMSQLHRRASSRMSRPAISIQNNGGWAVWIAFCADDVLPRSGTVGK